MFWKDFEIFKASLPNNRITLCAGGHTAHSTLTPATSPSAPTLLCGARQVPALTLGPSSRLHRTPIRKQLAPRKRISFCEAKDWFCHPTLAWETLGFPKLKKKLCCSQNTFLRILTSESIGSSSSSTLLKFGAPYRSLISASVLPESAPSYNHTIINESYNSFSLSNDSEINTLICFQFC